MNRKKISVVIPIYNVENFIERCATSLLEQTLKDVEYIFVDDASPDKSVERLMLCLNRYPEKITQVQLIRHEYNQGLPAARNTGLSVAEGEYIYHCDSDDYVERDMLEILYEAACKVDADWVWCDWFLSFNENERYMHQPAYKTAESVLRGILSGGMKYNVWNKLVKRSLYSEYNIKFPSGHAMGEDMTMICLAACAKQVAYVPKALYHYIQINVKSYTKRIDNTSLVDIRMNVDNVLAFLQQRCVLDLKREIAYFKLNVKLPFLISDNTKQYKLWEQWYTDANLYIMFNKELALRTRILQWMAWKKQFWYVRLYYWFFFKLVYGIIYK